MTMREKMARAMCEAGGMRGRCNGCGPDYGMETCTGYLYRRHVDAALDVLMPDLDTMDGDVMNDICAAFGAEGEIGLTAACTRAVTAYIRAAKDGK